MRLTTRYRFGNSLRNALDRRRKYTSTERNMKNSTKYAKPSTTKIKCWKTSYLISTFLSSKNMKQNSNAVVISWQILINGKADTRLHRKANWRNWRIFEPSWTANEKAWLTDKLGKWQFASKIKGLLSKTRSENAGIFSTVALVKLMTSVKKIKNKRFW